MRNFVADACEEAIRESKRGHTVVVLFPTWSRYGCCLRDIGFMPDGVYIRFSNISTSLKTLRVDTVIVVEPEKCTPDGLVWAEEMTSVSLEPRIVHLSEVKE